MKLFDVSQASRAVQGLCAVLLLFATLGFSGCVFAPPTAMTMPSTVTLGENGRSDTLVVMLPGRGDRADAFAEAGFEQAGLDHGFDSIAVDAHFGYYRERSLITRLHEDVIEPARAQGYENVWLLGISMGGLGALLYAAEHPDQVDGVILLAPFLGDHRAIETVVAAGGVDTLGERADDIADYELDVWSWLLGGSDGARPPVLLGYGVDDRMAPGYAAARDLMQPSAVYTRQGEHAWITWRPLWDEMADDLNRYL